MKKNGIVATLLIVTLSGCGSQDEYATPKVVGDNSADIKKHATMKPAAAAYSAKVTAAVDRFMEHAGKPVTLDWANEQSGVMNDVAKEGEQFDPFPSGQFHHCREAGFNAMVFWRAMVSQADRTVDIKEAQEKYRQSVKKCQQQINENAPEPQATVRASLKQKEPPYHGCLRVLLLDPPPGSNGAKPSYTQWTCPQGSIK